MIGKFFSTVKEGVNLFLEKKERERIGLVRGVLVRESVSCAKCDALSAPLSGTKDKYRCVKCGRQFANTTHRIDNIIRAAFTAHKQGDFYKSQIPEYCERVMKEMAKE